MKLGVAGSWDPRLFFFFVSVTNTIQHVLSLLLLLQVVGRNTIIILLCLRNIKLVLGSEERKEGFPACSLL